MQALLHFLISLWLHTNLLTAIRSIYDVYGMSLNWLISSLFFLPTTVDVSGISGCVSNKVNVVSIMWLLHAIVIKWLVLWCGRWHPSLWWTTWQYTWVFAWDKLCKAACLHFLCRVVHAGHFSIIVSMLIFMVNHAVGSMCTDWQVICHNEIAMFCAHRRQQCMW